MMIDEGKRTGSNDKMFFSADGTLTAKSEIDDSKNLLFNCNGKVISCSEKINNLVNVMGNGTTITATFIDEINKLNTISNSLQAKVDEFNKLNGILTSGEIDFAQYIADGGSIYVSAKDAVSGKSGLSIGASFLANPLDVYDTKEKKYLHLTKAQLNDAEYMAKLASQSQYALLFGNSYETAAGFVPLNKVFKVKSSSQTTKNTTSKMTASTVSSEILNNFDPNKYSSRKEYIDAAAPIIVDACKKYGFKYPSVVAAQMIWEGGFPIGHIATKDHALFGIKAANQDPSEWEYWTNGTGQGHSDGGYARSYNQYSDSIYDYVEWLSRNNGDGTDNQGNKYSSYLDAANSASNGQEALSKILQLGYCPSDYSAEAYSIAKANDALKYDDMVK